MAAASKGSGKTTMKTKVRERSKESKTQPDVYYENETDTKYSHPQYGPPKTYAPDIDKSYEWDESAISIDLTDPEDLMYKMQMLDLTDEETDELFQRAMEVNQQLKQQLSHLPPSAKTGYATSAPGGLRSLKRDGGTSLPPIPGADMVSFPASRLLPSAAAGSLSRSSLASTPTSSRSKVAVLVTLQIQIIIIIILLHYAMFYTAKLSLTQHMAIPSN